MAYKLQTLVSIFQDPIPRNSIPQFRAAISNLTGDVLLHHHKNTEELLYRYPLVQFKLTRYNQPLIFAIEAGIEPMLKIASLSNTQVVVRDIPYVIYIKSFTIRPFFVQVWTHTFIYKIQNWLALNPQNYKKYSEETSLKKKIILLESILKGNILSFASGIQWNIDKEIFLEIESIQSEYWIRYKEVLFLSFSLIFRSNVSLPNNIGLGKACSVGFGMIQQLKKNNKDVEEDDMIENKTEDNL